METNLFIVVLVLVLGGLAALIIWLTGRRGDTDEVDEPRKGK